MGDIYIMSLEGNLINLFCYSCDDLQGQYLDPDSDRGMFTICKKCAGKGPKGSPQNPGMSRDQSRWQRWHQGKTNVRPSK
jgi:NAD-dependent SIR2 family protein deacetylase